MNVVRFFIVGVAIACLAVAVCDCSSQITASGEGNGSETVARGRITDESGEPVANAHVMLLPSSYDPDSAPVLPARWQALTDNNGDYSITDLSIGVYNLEAYDGNYANIGLIQGIGISDLTNDIIIDTLRLGVSGTIIVHGDSIVLHPGDYLYVPGTSVFAMVDSQSAGNGSVTLSRVPSGRFGSIILVGSGETGNVLHDTITVASGSTVLVSNAAWKFSKRLVLNTTASGANVAGTVMNFPVLVRLNSGNFNFTDAKSGGEDIRFTKSDGAPLAYEIERWDASLRAAELWVKVDTVLGNDSLHFIMMYWGNPSAPSASNSAAVFDTLSGFQGVWHLNETTGQAAKDATGNHFDGTKLGSALPAPASGAIGIAQQFDGSSSFIQMPGTADGKLNFPENGSYSLSAWVYVDTLVDSTTHVIVSKGHEQYFLKLYWDGPHWEFTEYHDKSGWQVSSYSPAQARAWKYLVGVREGINQYLYLDGELVTGNYGIAANATARNTGDDFSIGKYLRSAGYPGEGFSWFDGKIDEVRVSSKSLGSDWIKLCYMNQKQTDALLKW